MRQPSWPQGKRFAFTIFDDTDMATMENVGPVYAFLEEIGLRTTKSVWPLSHSNHKVTWGSSCENKKYLDWVKSLQTKGFEIALHNVSATSNKRAYTEKGLKLFEQYFGQMPKSLANHAECRDTIYWADARFSSWVKPLYNALTMGRKKGQSQGHVESSPYFWGDLCAQHIRYVRNFVYQDINTLKLCPSMPYHDPKRPYAQRWFASANGTDCKEFLRCVNMASIDRLEAEGGACIMYTHLARGFAQKGVLDPNFRTTMLDLAKRGGWFVPVTQLLDFLNDDPSRVEFTDRERARMERRWLWEKLQGAPQ